MKLTAEGVVVNVNIDKPFESLICPIIGDVNVGVTIVGDVAKTGAPVPVAATQPGTPPAFVNRPALAAVVNPATVFVVEL